MICLKPLEVRSYRDRMITAFLLYFLTLTSLLYADTFFMLLYMLASVALTTALLVRIQDPEANIVSPVTRSGQLVLLAVPVMVLFFVLFPRLPGGFWQLSTPNVARAGFSETLSPGSISRLVLNRETAFRVAVEDAAVPAGQRYWRGLVLSEFDGRSWHPGPEPPAAEWPGQDGIVQQIELEPHHQRWLFALDRPLSMSAEGRLLADRTLRSAAKVKKRIRYSAVSSTQSGPVSLQPWEKRSVYALPPGGNPEARRLAARWQNESETPARIIDRALSYFGSSEFVYSLNPPLLGSDPIDDFLLTARKGFCEHYASAFAFLMRAAGVPARIVVGYLGGEVNPFGGYLIVRQSDAHAWVEVWLESRGWIRVDPTGVVAPERAEGGTDAALPPEERVRRQAFERVPILGDAIHHLALGWDAVNTFWNRRVLGYSAATQRRILSRLGIVDESWK
jgi:transglutaminase-like putative cysteine protease